MSSLLEASKKEAPRRPLAKTKIGQFALQKKKAEYYYKIFLLFFQNLQQQYSKISQYKWQEEGSDLRGFWQRVSIFINLVSLIQCNVM